MKKLFLVVSMVVLLAAACNQQPSAQQNTQTTNPSAQPQTTQIPPQTQPASAATNSGWKTYTYKNLSFQYPPQGWVVLFNSAVAGQTNGYDWEKVQPNGFDISIVKESQQKSMQPNELTLKTYNDYSGTPTSYAPSPNRVFTKSSTGDSFIEFTVGNTPIYAGCAYYQADKDTFDICNQIVPTINVAPDTSIASNMFSYPGVEVGQKVGAMIVDKVSSMDGHEISNNNIHVEFIGNVTLTGTLSAPTGNPADAGMGPEYSINDLSVDSLKKLPYLKDDNRTVWFGIRNPDVVKNTGLKNRDKVEITISKYYYGYWPADVWNEADITSIKKVQ